MLESLDAPTKGAGGESQAKCKGPGDCAGAMALTSHTPLMVSVARTAARANKMENGACRHRRRVAHTMDWHGGLSEAKGWRAGGRDKN